LKKFKKWNNFLEKGLEKLKLMKFNHNGVPLIEIDAGGD
jgi:hypothetical protein